MELKSDPKVDCLAQTLCTRAAELEEEFLSRLQQFRVDLVKAREQILFLEKGCHAAQSAMERAKAYVPIVAREYECPNCFVRMGISGTLFESTEIPPANTMKCRKCSTSFSIPKGS